jgi:hypothetical protein
MEQVFQLMLYKNGGCFRDEHRDSRGVVLNPSNVALEAFLRIVYLVTQINQILLQGKVG